MNLGTSLHWVSTKMRDKICIIENDTRVSYSELWSDIELLAKAFLKIGIKENDRIAIILPNCKEFVYSFYALSRINAISVPLNYYLTSHEAKNILDDCQPRAIITTSFFYDKSILSIAGTGKITIFIDESSEDRKGTYSFKDLFKIGEPGDLPGFSTNNNQIASINYTYRGLGKPLGAMLTHANYHHGAITYVRLTEVVTEQRVLLITPMSHIFTLVSCVIVSLLRGATIVIMRGFIPNHVFKAIEENKINFIIAVPTAYISLLRNYNKSRFDISSLKRGITGGSYLPAEVHREIKEKMGIELFQGYGLTETVPVTCNPRLKNKPESVGVPGHKVKIKIVDEDGTELPRGEKGEIVIGGWSVMKGYYNRNGINKEFLRDGWFWSGDYGCMDKDGYVYFKGLKKDIIKMGGNNVDLKEVKDTIGCFPGVIDVRLDILEDALWGHRLSAEVEVKSAGVTGRMIKSFCSERLTTYKIPRVITIRQT